MLVLFAFLIFLALVALVISAMSRTAAINALTLAEDAAASVQRMAEKLREERRMTDRLAATIVRMEPDEQAARDLRAYMTLRGATPKADTGSETSE